VKARTKLELERLVARAAGRRDLAQLLAAATVVAILVGDIALAYAARPGGGSSYSGGSRSSGGGSYSGGSSGGGSGDGEAIVYLIILCFQHPTLGIPLLFLFVGFVIVRSKLRRSFRGNEWTTAAAGFASVSTAMAPPEPVRRAPLRARLSSLRHTDPAFSVIVFEDFVYFLYAEMHRARGAAAAESLASYLTDHVRARLRNDGRIAEVTGIIIGGISYEQVQVDPSGGARVTLVVESNYVERYRPQGEQRFYVKERLHLTRAAGARSRAPAKARTLDCPNCGAPLSAMRGKTCSFCNTVIETGAKDWAISAIDLLEREPRGPLLTSSVEEQGTNLPTILDPSAHAAFAQIQAKDPQFSWDRLQHRVGLIFQEFHAGWVGRDPARVRPFVSDNLFQSQMYWIDLYRTSRCINRTDGSHITRLELASATTDAYYDSITVRLYATGLDYTISEDGRLLSGSKSRQRAYSEYWTIIRGAQKKPTDKGDRQCPNCGAGLDINMTGNCKFCGVKVTSGEYDWVLSRIEQDEAYSG
jgi:hypothetical protein